MTDCIFCRIIAGEIPSNKVYEDEHVLAFLDISPVAEGHTLVVPKKHSATLPELSFSDMTHVFSVVRKVDEAQRERIGVGAVSVLLRDGPAAGQEVSHLHVHCIPRSEDDGLSDGLVSGSKADPDDLTAVADRLRLN